MKKNFKYFSILWAIMFVLFNALTFIITSNTVGLANVKGSFWFAYVMIVISFVGQLFCGKIAFSGNITRLFYNIPLIKVSYSGLIATTVIGTILMALNKIPSWIVVSICLIVLAFEAIAIVKAEAAAELIQNKDEAVKQKTMFIRNLTTEAEILLKSAQTEEEKRELKKLYEAIKYSDPVTSKETQEIENNIAEAFSTLKAEFSISTVQRIIQLIQVRGQKCKVAK